MKKFLTHKLLPILSIFLLIINVFAIYSFAAINITCSNGYTASIPDLPDNPYSDYLIYFDAFGASLYFFNYDESNPPKFRFKDGEYFSFELVNVKFKRYNINNSKWSLLNQTSSSTGLQVPDFLGFYSTCNVYNGNSMDILNPSFNNPSFINTKEELSSGKFDSLKINAGDLGYNDEFGLAIFDATSNLIQVEDAVIPNLKPVKSFVLNSKSDYFRSSDLHIYYDIPQSSLQLDISNGKKYMFCLVNLDDYTLYNSIIFTVGGMTSEEEIKNAQDVTNDKLDEQTNAIKDQTETNKNIFEKIGDILSYINPLSPNFFVYKLIELLVNAIKSLFIPSEEFFR